MPFFNFKSKIFSLSQTILFISKKNYREYLKIFSWSIEMKQNNIHDNKNNNKKNLNKKIN